MINCIICQGETVQKSFLSRNNNEMQLYCCNNCGHYAQDINEYKDIYSDGTFTKVARDERLKIPSAYKIEQLDRRANKRFYHYKSYLTPTANVIEIGSSIGSFVHLLKMYGCKAIGLEPDPDYCQFSQSQYGFEQVNSLIEEFSSNTKYDVIFSFHVIEHVRNPHLFISKVKELLKEGGVLVLECPSMEIKNYGDIQSTIWEPHIHYFNVASIYALLAPCFGDIKIEYFESGLSIIAKNVSSRGIETAIFKKFKRKRDIISSLIDNTPKFNKNSKITTLRNLFLQSILEKNGILKRTQKGVELGNYKLREYFYLKKETGEGANKIVHITNYKGWGNNAGDIVLSSCVRTALRNRISNANFDIHSLKERVNIGLINKINHAKSLVIGGGGLFLPDTNQNSISGWQWGVSKELLDQIKVPIILFAIGYNYFPGQNPNKLFVENLNHIIGKSDFIGIRNMGSIQSIKELLNDDLKNKNILFQPCPTTLIRRYVKDVSAKKTTRNIAINIAFDRYERRFGNEMIDKLLSIARALKSLEKKSYKIFNVCHLTIDEKAEIIFDRVGLNYETIRMQHMLPSDIYEFYNKMEVVIGMRGHAQMIPFGTNTKIITLGSHRKMKWFLDDINLPEVYIDVNTSPNLGEELLEKFEYVMSKVNHVDELLLSEQERLFNATQQNLEAISELLSKH